MKYFTLITDRDSTFQTLVDTPPDHLLKKDLYTAYAGGPIQCIKLAKRAKLTDVLSDGTLNLKGHIISDRFYQTIKPFNLFEIQFVDIIDKHLEGYKFMFFNSDLTNRIDYEKSNFRVVRTSPLKQQVLDIPISPTREGILKAYKEHCARSIFKDLKPQNGYIFKSSFDLVNTDAFRIGHFDKHFYLSESVEKELRNKGLTGYECMESTLLS